MYIPVLKGIIMIKIHSGGSECILQDQVKNQDLGTPKVHWV